jgi:hypothetical protein
MLALNLSLAPHVQHPHALAYQSTEPVAHPPYLGHNLDSLDETVTSADSVLPTRASSDVPKTAPSALASIQKSSLV